MKLKYKILIGITLLLIAMRIALPYVVLHYANKTLVNMKGYYGHIQDVDLSLYRGAYLIKSVYLNKVDSVSFKHSDFFKSENIELSLEWPALFQGSVVGELVFNAPLLIFTKNKAELGDIKKDTADFRKLLKTFMPLKVNRVTVNNGSIHYIDHSSKPELDIALKQAHILALNLTNITNTESELPSTITAEASLYEGTFTATMRLNALAPEAAFDLNAELKNTNLVLLNSFFKVYGNFDVNKGRFGLYTELATHKGKFIGYVKPIINDLDVLGPEDRKDSFLQQMWEAMVGATGTIFKNHNKNQLATKVKIEGSFKHPETSTLDAVWEVLNNAFIQALMPVVDNNISIKSLDPEKKKNDKNLLQRIFSSKTKNKK